MGASDACARWSCAACVLQSYASPPVHAAVRVCQVAAAPIPCVLVRGVVRTHEDACACVCCVCSSAVWVSVLMDKMRSLRSNTHNGRAVGGPERADAGLGDSQERCLLLATSMVSASPLYSSARGAGWRTSGT